jgi:hypothetical protein
MNSIPQAMCAAAGELQRISDANFGPRGQRAAVVALVLRTFDQQLNGEQVARFSLRRAATEVERIDAGAERAILTRLLLLEGSLSDPEALESIVELLVDYGYELELTRRLPEADAVLALARALAPDSPGVALHAGRVARKQGDRERALALYCAARRLDRASGTLARLAEIGEAVVSPDPLPLLGVALRRAVGASDAEAAAVALEERARVRRGRGDRSGAARDLCIAAVRFSDPVDRARVAHQLADLFATVGDALAVREALLLALSVGDASQRDHARARLHAVSRDLHDEIGARRWRSFQPPSLVSLSTRSRVSEPSSSAPRLARWREQVEALTAAHGQSA